MEVSLLSLSPSPPSPSFLLSVSLYEILCAMQCRPSLAHYKPLVKSTFPLTPCGMSFLFKICKNTFNLSLGWQEGKLGTSYVHIGLSPIVTKGGWFNGMKVRKEDESLEP